MRVNGGYAMRQSSQRRWWELESVALAVTGVLLVIAAVMLAIMEKSDAAIGTLAVAGAGSLIAAPLVARVEGTFRIGPFEMSLRSAVISAVRDASESNLKGVLPLVEARDVKVAEAIVPASFGGKTMVDLPFVRKRLKLSVLAVKNPDNESWNAGGLISEVVLEAGGRMLIAGPLEAVDYFAMLTRLDDDALWNRVM